MLWMQKEKKSDRLTEADNVVKYNLGEMKFEAIHD